MIFSTCITCSMNTIRFVITFSNCGITKVYFNESQLVSLLKGCCAMGDIWGPILLCPYPFCSFQYDEVFLRQINKLLYALPRDILFLVLCVRSSVCMFVRLSLKFFGQCSLWWSWSPIRLKLSTHVPFDMTLLMPSYAKSEFNPNFTVHWTKNNSANGASVFYGHIFVYKCVTVFSSTFV